MQLLLIGLHHFTQPTGLCRFTASQFLSWRSHDSIKVTLVLGVWQKEYYARTFDLNPNDPDIVWVEMRHPRWSRYAWYMWGAPRLAHRRRADVVHAMFPMPLMKHLFSCPIVTTVHDLYAWDVPETIGYPNVWLNKISTTQGLRASDAAICISSAARSSVRKWFPVLENRMPLPVIYQEFRPRSLQNDQASSQNEAGERPFLLCVAQHRKHKNLDLAIEAYYRAMDEEVLPATTRLVIVGSPGPQTLELEALARSRPGVEFLSGIPDDRLAELYRGCMALLCTSSIEGFCLPVAEALTFSCRVICSDIPVLREVAGEQGTFFPLSPRDPDALVTALKDALHSDRHLNGKSPILATDLSKRTLQIYSELLRNGLQRNPAQFKGASLSGKGKTRERRIASRASRENKYEAVRASNTVP